MTGFVSGDANAVDELLTDDCVLHQPRWPLDFEGRDAVVEKTREISGTFTDVIVSVEQSVVSGDRIAVYPTASGRNVGAFRTGDREVAPTGRPFEVPSSESTGRAMVASQKHGFSQTRRGSSSSSTTSRRDR